MIPCYNKLSNPLVRVENQDSWKSFKIRNFAKYKFFLEIALIVVLLKNFDFILIPCNILVAVKLSNPFVTAKNQNCRKCCKKRNFANYKFF